MITINQGFAKLNKIKIIHGCHDVGPFSLWSGDVQ